jgi:hypothetical protein
MSTTARAADSRPALSGLVAAGPRTYDLQSEAVAVATTLNDPGVPFGIPFSVGSYGASSKLNSNGISEADAGAPYSPLVSSLPGTGNGIFQSSSGVGLPVVPAFPGYVTAKDPLTPVHKQNAGGYALTATADRTGSKGTVSIGAQAATSEQNNAFASADSLTSEDGVVSEGAAGVHALTLGGILDLANVSSYAGITRSLDGGVSPVTETYLGTVSFAGLTSGLSASGLSVLGSEPTPLSVEGMGALNQALRPAGITFAYLPEMYSYADGTSSEGSTPDAKKQVVGVTSGALRIVFENTSERGTTTETVTVGRVSARATSAGPTAATAGSSDVVAGDAGTVGSSVGAVDPAAAAGVPPQLPGAAGKLPATAASAELPSREFLRAASSTLSGESVTSFKSLYLVLAALAAAALVASQGLRVVAARRD